MNPADGGMRYYGYYSNKSRGLRKKAETDDDIPVIVKNEMPSQEWRQNWARLIQKIYEVDPLISPKCQGEMRILSSRMRRSSRKYWNI
jgi:hypothetical protein